MAQFFSSSQRYHLSTLIERMSAVEHKANSIDPSCNQAAFKQTLPQKKNMLNLLSEQGSALEKTSKIKKNKKNKKKKGQLSAKEKLSQQNITKKTCQCCCGNLESAITNDGYQSDDEDESLQESIQKMIQMKSEQLFEDFYHKIQRCEEPIRKDDGSQQGKTLLKVAKILGQIYNQYMSQLYDFIKQQSLDIETDQYERDYNYSFEFKNYIITRFPLLKDFIQNFKMTDLKEKQELEFRELQTNSLIAQIYFHIQQIAQKKSKKKNRRRQQKLNKQMQEKQEMSKKKCKQTLQSFYELNEIIQSFRTMKINKNERTSCYFNFEEFGINQTMR